MSELRDQHKAFAEWFLQQNPVAPNAEDLAWAAWKAALAQPETTAEPVAWLNRHHAAMVTQDHATAVAMGFTTPLYAHPPCDRWRLASDPPENGRDVVVWMNDGGHGCFAIGHCLRGNWSPYFLGSPVTQWRDIEPPEQEGER